MTSMMITGASSGIGRALAEAAAELGFEVTACGRNEQRLRDLANGYPNMETLAFDVSDEQACQRALNSKKFDVVVLNAGTCEYVDMDTFDPAMFRRVFDANFFGAVNCVNALLRSFGKDSQLVFIDSLARLLPFTRSEAYGASKAALHYFARSLEVDLKHRGVCVQTISPGFVRTPLTNKNEFDMPMRVEPEEAATAIIRLIEKRKSSGYFPTLFAGVLRFLGSLPTTWQVRLCGRMKNTTATKRENANEMG